MVLLRAVFAADVEKNEKRGNTAIPPQCLLEASIDLQHRDYMGEDSIPVFNGFQSYFMHWLVYFFEDSHSFLAFASWGDGESMAHLPLFLSLPLSMPVLCSLLPVPYESCTLFSPLPNLFFFFPHNILFSNWRDLPWFLFQTSNHTHCPSLILPQHYSILFKRATQCWECRHTSDVHSDTDLFSVLLFYSFLIHSNINFLSLSVDVFRRLPAIEPQISFHPLCLQELVPENQLLTQNL